MMTKRHKVTLQSRLTDYWELTKPRVTFMVLISVFGGFYLATRSSLDVVLLIHALLGSWLVAGGTNALNQLIERDRDALMRRTKNRPLPASRVLPKHAGFFAASISVVGILQLILAVNLLTGLLAATTLATYIFVYTPLKRQTSLSTLVGAVPGALPAMGGWAAAAGTVGIEAWVLFAILFFWQLPHFLAIALIYRDDYARGGFSVLPVEDQSGTCTGLQIILNCLALLSVSLLPTLLGLTGLVYFLGALILGMAFLASGIRVAVQKSNRYAKQLLHASIIYLPLLMTLMLIDKVAA